MSRPLSERELARVQRSISGHHRDKDRARWKRKVSGQIAAKPSRRKPAAAEEEESPRDLEEPGGEE
jgi:hypothetical protein